MAQVPLHGDSRGMSTQAVSAIKVFVAEDSELIRSRVCNLLVSEGMTIVGEATNPEDAINRILSALPDVVVLDVQLEGGTGLQVLRAVRSVAPAVSFVVFSNNAGPAYRKRYLADGASCFLDKSAEFNLLGQAVTHASQQACH